jgi:hypothetical protein
MLKMLLWLVPALIAGSLLLAANWSYSLAPPAPQVLTHAIANLSSDKVSWLKTKIRQTMTDADSTYCAEGTLLRGPNHCARLEMKALTGGSESRLLVVSDGDHLALERAFPGVEPKIVSNPLPEAAGTTRQDESARDEYLAARGCGGPGAVLRKLQVSLQNLKLQTGLLQGRPVIQLKGDLDPRHERDPAISAIRLRCCFLFLDAQTLWPVRVEWWGSNSSRGLRCVLQTEFLDPVLNQELTVEQCVQAFSYQPGSR